MMQVRAWIGEPVAALPERLGNRDKLATEERRWLRRKRDTS